MTRDRLKRIYDLHAWVGVLAGLFIFVVSLSGVFALFGEKARYINMAAISVLALFAVSSLAPVQTILPVAERVGFNGWFIWLLLIMLVIGPFHPPALDDVTRLDFRRRLVGYAVIVIFILTFVPVPMRIVA